MFKLYFSIEVRTLGWCWPQTAAEFLDPSPHSRTTHWPEVDWKFKNQSINRDSWKIIVLDQELHIENFQGPETLLTRNENISIVLKAGP